MDDPDLSGESTGVPEFPAGTVPAGTVLRYTCDRTAAVDGGLEVTLRLHCLAEARGDGNWYPGVTSIDVLHGETLLQTLSIRDAIVEEYRREGFDWEPEGQTQCWDPEGDLIVEDLNFDGIPDLRLMEGAGVVNIRYLCWLWDSQARRYEYRFSLLGYDVTADPEAKQIVTESRGGWGQYYRNYYVCGGNGELLCVREEWEDYTAASDGKPAATVRELVDGAWVQMSP